MIKSITVIFTVVSESFYTDIHIHVPTGAIPKDGPLAGVSITTSLVSALSGIPVLRDVGMTGEITLRGRVMPIGGLKEKLLAAKRAGLKKVVLPAKNKKDLTEVPQAIIRDLNLVFVDNIDEMLKNTLESDPFAGQKTQSMSSEAMQKITSVSA